jgi:hypothetical protein
MKMSVGSWAHEPVENRKFATTDVPFAEEERIRPPLLFQVMTEITEDVLPSIAAS